MEVKTKPGSILDARVPAACQFYFTPLGLMIDLISSALSPALADTVPAAHYGDGMIFQFTGINPRTDELFLDNEPHVGGWGASHGEDGEDGMIWTLSGNFHDMSIEVFESKFPALITEYGYRQDSAGPGSGGEATASSASTRPPTPTWSVGNDLPRCGSRIGTRFSPSTGPE